MTKQGVDRDLVAAWGWARIRHAERPIFDRKFAVRQSLATLCHDLDKIWRRPLRILAPDASDDASM